MEQVKLGLVMLAHTTQNGVIPGALWLKERTLSGDLVFTQDEAEAFVFDEVANDEGIIDNFIQTAGIRIDEEYSVSLSLQEGMGSSYLASRILIN
jgi:hypothetical protein